MVSREISAKLFPTFIILRFLISPKFIAKLKSTRKLLDVAIETNG